MVYLPYSIALIGIAISAIVLAIYGWQHSAPVGKTAFTGFMIAIVLYAGGYAIGLSSSTTDQSMFGIRIEYIGVAVISPLWLIMILRFTGKRAWIANWILVALFSIPAITVFIAFTNDLHHLLYSSVGLSAEGAFSAIQFERGPWYWVNCAYSGLLFWIGALLLIQYLWREKTGQQTATIVMLITFFAIGLGQVIYLTGNSPNNIDMGPFILIVSGPPILVELFHFKILNLIPMARNMVFENISDGVLILDSQTAIIDANPAAFAILGLQRNQIIGKQFHSIDNLIPEAVETGIDPHSSTALVKLPGAKERHLELLQSIILGPDYVPSGSIVILRDITARTLAEEALVEREQMYRTLVENMRDLVWTTDTNLVFTYISPTNPLFGGFTPEEGLKKTILDFMPIQSQEVIKKEWAAFKQQLAIGDPLESGSLVLEQYDKHGGTIWTEVSYRPIFSENGVFSGFQGLTRDITQRKLADEALKQSHDRLAHLATHDPLTNLANRVLCEDRLAQAITRAQTLKTSLGFLMIDLDDFKDVNDSRGHAAGDEVLKIVAQRMQSNVQQVDTVCRLAGDEFIILLENITNAEEARLVAQRVRQKIAQPLQINDDMVQIDCSIGIALFPEHAYTPKELSIQADRAMYAAKLSPNHICVVGDIELQMHNNGTCIANLSLPSGLF